MRSLLIMLALVACNKQPEKAPEPKVPDLTCKDAIENSALDPTASNVVMGIKQCDLEKWGQPLLRCINDAPPGSDLESACFARVPKR